MSWVNVVWLCQEHVVVETVCACFVVVCESAHNVDVFVGIMVEAMVLDRVNVVFVTKNWLVWR